MLIDQALQEIESLREELRFYKTDAAASKSSLLSALSENQTLLARVKGRSQSPSVMTADMMPPREREHAFESTNIHPPHSSPANHHTFARTASREGRSSRNSQPPTTTDYYSDVPPLHPATRQQILSRTIGQRQSSMSDSEAMLARKPIRNTRQYPYEDSILLRKQSTKLLTTNTSGADHSRDIPRNASNLHHKPSARSSSNYRYNTDGMSVGSDVDTVSSSVYGYDDRAAVLSSRPIERSRRTTTNSTTSMSVSSAGSTSLKYDRLKSMYKRVTGKDMSRLEYATQYPDSDDD